MAHILIVDDDEALAEMVADWLAHERHTVETVHDGIEAKQRIHLEQFDAVFLDWEMPGCSGWDVLSDVRSKGNNVPIIMLTGKSLISEKEQILDGGADDYITKPFHMKELSARLRVVLRRSAGSSTNTLKAGDLELDPRKHKVTKAGVVVDLQRSEFALLEFLMRHPNQVFSTETLLERVWGRETESSEEAIHSCVKRLRKKLDQGGEVIVTLRGEGYRLDP